MSTFQTNLPNLSWAHSIENILKYHDTYFKTINQFTQNSADFIYNLSYEKLIVNPEKETKNFELTNYLSLQISLEHGLASQKLINKSKINFLNNFTFKLINYLFKI